MSVTSVIIIKLLPLASSSSTVVPMIMAHDITTYEDGGSASITVQLMNEIERNFVLKYKTGELPAEASGTYVIDIMW